MRTLKGIATIVVGAGWYMMVAGAAPPSTQPAKELTLDLGNKVTMKLTLIPAGKFLMGSPEDEEGHLSNESPQHEVTISKPFYMGVYEVTVDQFAAFVKDSKYQTGAEKKAEAEQAKPGKADTALWRNPGFDQKGNHPVIHVTWNDAEAFSGWLSKRSGKVVRLPTEAQWEYACRAGSKTRFCFGDKDEDLRKYGTYRDKLNTVRLPSQNRGDSDGLTKTTPVGSLKPNDWGLYDMHGNVSEWCSDWYAISYAKAGRIDPTGPAEPTTTPPRDDEPYVEACRVLRGGCWDYGAPYARSANRDRSVPAYCGASLGFRVVVNSN